MGFLKTLFGLGGKESGSDAGSGRLKTGAGAIDPSCQYCPQCGEEYRPEIVECAHCHVGLISGAEKMARLGIGRGGSPQARRALSNTDILSVLKTGKLRDIKHIQQYLEEHSIESRLSAVSSSCTQG